MDIVNDVEKDNNVIETTEPIKKIKKVYKKKILESIDDIVEKDNLKEESSVKKNNKKK